MGGHGLFRVSAVGEVNPLFVPREFDATLRLDKEGTTFEPFEAYQLPDKWAEFAGLDVVAELDRTPWLYETYRGVIRRLDARDGNVRLWASDRQLGIFDTDDRIEVVRGPMLRFSRKARTYSVGSVWETAGYLMPKDPDVAPREVCDTCRKERA